MTPKFCLATASTFGFLSILMGAVVAHALKERLSDQQIQWLDLASRMQLMHSILLVALSWGLTNHSKWIHRAVLLFIVGIILFSGSLYGLALTETRKWAFITPFGGLSLLAGWLLLLRHSFTKN